MSRIKEVIEYLETGKIPDNPPEKLLQVIDRLQQSPSYYVKFWESLQQFYTPKIQSTNYVPETNTEERDVTITVVNDEP